jgi:hypothetical protein
MKKSTGIKKRIKQNDNTDFLICCVKNCNNEIKPGTEVKIGNDIYCASCGTIVFKDSLGL